MRSAPEQVLAPGADEVFVQPARGSRRYPVTHGFFIHAPQFAAAFGAAGVADNEVELAKHQRELFLHRWQYTHFAGLWETTTPRQRVVFCQQCDGVTPATDGRCSGCGMELFDPYASAGDAAAR